MISLKYRVVPIRIADHLRELISPPRLFLHRSIGHEFTLFKLAVRPGNRLFVFAQFRFVNLDEEHGAIRQQLPFSSAIDRSRIGVVVAHLLSLGKADRGVVGKRLLVVCGKFNSRSEL